MAEIEQILIAESQVNIQVDVDGKKTTKQVFVREMKWKDALAFVGQLTGLFRQFTSPGEDGKPTFDMGRLTEAITGSAALAETLVLKSTGLTSEELGEFTSQQTAAILKLALDVNLSEAALGKYRGVAAKVRQAFAGDPAK